MSGIQLNIIEPPKEDTRALYKFVKSFLIGYSLPVIPSLISLTIRRISSLMNSTKYKNSIMYSAWKILSSGGFLKFGLSFGVMGGGYPLLFQYFDKLFTNKIYSSFLAGFISGFGILIDNSESGLDRRLILALYVLVRGLEMIYQSLVVNGYLNKIEHLDTILFTASCYEIMSCWFYYPHALPKSYNKWITNIAEIDPVLLQLAKLQKDGGWKVGLSTDVMQHFACKQGFDPREGNPINGFVPCKFIHPFSKDSCTQGNAVIFGSTFKKALMLYFPVHLIPLLIWKRKILISNPLESVIRGVFDVLRSSAFLSTFVGLIYFNICFWRNAFKEDTLWGPLLGAATCGLSVLVEKKSRRMELALYCLPRAAHCLFEKAFQRLAMEGVSKLNAQVRIGTVLFAIGLGLITCTMECEPHVQSSFIRNLLLWFFGN